MFIPRSEGVQEELEFKKSSIYRSKSGRFKVGGTMMSLLTTTKWQQSAIMIHYPRAAACLYREAKEFKKSSSSRRAQHDPLP